MNNRTILIVDDLNDFLDPYADVMAVRFPEHTILAVKSVEQSMHALKDEENPVVAAIFDGGFLDWNEDKTEEIRTSGTGIRVVEALRNGSLGERVRHIPVVLNTADPYKKGYPKAADGTLIMDQGKTVDKRIRFLETIENAGLPEETKTKTGYFLKPAYKDLVTKESTDASHTIIAGIGHQIATFLQIIDPTLPQAGKTNEAVIELTHLVTTGTAQHGPAYHSPTERQG